VRAAGIYLKPVLPRVTRYLPSIQLHCVSSAPEKTRPGVVTITTAFFPAEATITRLRSIRPPGVILAEIVPVQSGEPHARDRFVTLTVHL
jgi:hypothetical protein